MKLFRFARICWMVTLTIEFNGLTDALFQTTHTHKHTHRWCSSHRLIHNVWLCMYDRQKIFFATSEAHSMNHPSFIWLNDEYWNKNDKKYWNIYNIQPLLRFHFFSAPSMNRNHCLYLYTNKFNMKSHNSMADERRRRHNRIFFVFCWWNTKCWITSKHSHNKHLSHNGNCFFCIICSARCCYIYSLLSCEPKMPNANFKWTNNLKKKHKK